MVWPVSQSTASDGTTDYRLQTTDYTTVCNSTSHKRHQQAHLVLRTCPKIQGPPTANDTVSVLFRNAQPWGVLQSPAVHTLELQLQASCSKVVAVPNCQVGYHCHCCNVLRQVGRWAELGQGGRACLSALSPYPHVRMPLEVHSASLPRQVRSTRIPLIARVNAVATCQS